MKNRIKKYDSVRKMNTLFFYFVQHCIYENILHFYAFIQLHIAYWNAHVSQKIKPWIYKTKI